MLQLTRLNVQVVRKAGIARRQPQFHSGQQVLENLIAVADEADKRFTEQAMTEFWKPGFVYPENPYGKFVRDMAASLGLNENPLYSPHEPISGYNQQHRLGKKQLPILLPHLQIVNPGLTEKVEQEGEFILVVYTMWYSIDESTHYFDKRDFSWLQELYLRVRGFRERTRVEEEIVHLLKKGQKNPQETPIDGILSNPRDLSEYKQRLFTLQRKREDLTQTDGSWPVLIWGFGVYTRWPELIGYVLINKDATASQRRLLG
jgi:hypothetical protein